MAVPHSALPLLGTGLLMVVLVAAAMPWWSGKAVPDLLHWLGSSPAAVAARRSRAATKAGAAPPKRRGGAAH